MKLNLGSGKKPVPDCINVDLVMLPDVNVIANLDTTALPFKSSSIEGVYAYHVLEHIRELPRLMEEIHRICMPDAIISIEVPYFACIGAFGDPTHVRFFTYETFRFWEARTDQWNWFSSATYRIRRRSLQFGKLHRLLGIQAFANRFPNIYENFLVYLFPARLLQVELSVVK